MTEAELDEAMLQMDADGSGEVDLPEFTKWYKSLSVPKEVRPPSTRTHSQQRRTELHIRSRSSSAHHTRSANFWKKRNQ